MDDLSNYLALRNEHQAAADAASEAHRAYRLLRDESEALSKRELAARMDVLAAEKAAIRLRTTIVANNGDTSGVDADLLDYSEALGR